LKLRNVLGSARIAPFARIEWWAKDGEDGRWEIILFHDTHTHQDRVRL
jgi:hypothetical protein